MVPPGIGNESEKSYRTTKAPSDCSHLVRHAPPRSFSGFIRKMGTVEAILVGVQFFNRGILVDFSCKTYGSRETVTHVLRDCPFARSGISDARAWQEAQKRKPATTHNQLNPPPAYEQANIRCYVDAAWQAESLSCGMGMVFEYSNGNHTSSFSSSRHHVSSALAAEAWAIREALLLSLNEVYAIVSDIRQLTISFSSISFVYILQTLNTAADFIAKEALRAILIDVP
ncbi:hypothetical protein EUTSA_v10002231mg [Eutrema salsugineum]|uniref:RNase H type-1 domain-containing protein n=1 Tax=Eutrema salsugineum TaxID=72664 RepID=V4LIA0_EUTSA|nr:hypothetical protein EUTSA_v10002231mg [Eutrema salsugineum]